MSRATADERSENYGPGFEYRSLTFGFFSLVVALPCVIFAVRELPVNYWMIIPVLDVDLSIQLMPRFHAGGFDVQEWIWGLKWDLILLVVAVGYYLALITVVIGILLTLGGMIVIAGPREIAESIRDVLAFRPIQMLLGFYTVVGLGLFFPVIFHLLVEVFVTLLVAGPILGILGLSWWRFRASQGFLIRVLLLYPVALGIGILPFAAAALASPTFGPWFRSASTHFAIIVLDSVFAAGGLDEWIRATFDLAGVNYFLMWFGIVLATGWSIGVAIERFGKPLLRIGARLAE